MGIFDPGFGRDPGGRSYQGKGSGPSSSDGDGGLELGQEGGCRVESGYKGDAVFNRSC